MGCHIDFGEDADEIVFDRQGGSSVSSARIALAADMREGALGPGWFAPPPFSIGTEEQTIGETASVS